MSTINEHLPDSPADDFNSVEFAQYMDSLPDALSDLRDNFAYPTRETLDTGSIVKSAQHEISVPAIYFCGNSLGLMPKGLRSLVDQELDVWAGRGVMGHFNHPFDRPWKDITDTVQASMARIVGAETSEVAVMGSLTSNLHTLLCTFYKPEGRRTKILYEAKAFPSDEYAFTSQVRLHGLSPKEHLLAIRPRDGEYALRTEDILQAMQKNRDEIALVMFSGVQYYTGQFFDVDTITKKGHEIGAIVGWDLAHAVGNVILNLHKWQVDFACWCNYKYMNAGPGAIAGIFVHNDAKHPRRPQAERDEFEYENRLSGWWGHNAETKFKMEPTFDPQPGAAGYQLSNPSILNTVSLLASLRVFDATSMHALRTKSKLLTGYLELLLSRKAEVSSGMANYEIITPRDPEARGAQLSVLFKPIGQGVMEFVMAKLLGRGIVADERQPDVIRLSPIPSYNTFWEVREVAIVVSEAVDAWRPSESGDEKNMTQTS
ncbi:Kynureninase 2 [Taphrina deformans PYCC 5710]|uniref:Kynureninase n=1 Tax=Taphrina deformans (strain PYCC 5710 / ATCC 11124 / CBS 356.35 / IMI 108563 / JCM 9778 / NBRC 8474) TaxID=1097556 RepID=R4XG63_TAPDE|nr:Kynureninase 2 [Taphrina deformans PYCC 5710]|eukprot:CCG82374.1 Kynureninase 2 [Taphrina deformans PYCC 5710]